MTLMITCLDIHSAVHYGGNNTFLSILGLSILGLSILGRVVVVVYHKLIHHFSHNSIVAYRQWFQQDLLINMCLEIASYPCYIFFLSCIVIKGFVVPITIHEDCFDLINCNAVLSTRTKERKYKSFFV